MAFLAGPAGQCMVSGHGWCMGDGAWQCTASCMGGVPDGGWVKACVHYLVGKNACTYYLDLVKLELGLGLYLVWVVFGAEVVEGWCVKCEMENNVF